MNIVKIVKIKSYLPKKYESWLDFWESKSGQKTNLCIEKLCTCNDIVGVHVKKAEDDEQSYVVPLCTKHSKSASEIEVLDAFQLVSLK